MRLPFFTAAFLLINSAASACPWAGGTYTGSISGEIDIRFTFDAGCGSVEMRETDQNTIERVPLAATNSGWDAQFSGNTRASFNTNGQRARVSRGGRARTIRLRRVN